MPPVRDGYQLGFQRQPGCPAGILNVAEHVSDDTCLYFENYIFRTINESAVANDVKSAALTGLTFYLGLESGATPQQIAYEVRLDSHATESSCACMSLSES